jgi:molecular chaperone GrpE (heat shock protein)
MKYLEELEQKVLQIVQKNKELSGKIDELTKENERLAEQCRQYETSLMKEFGTTQALASEKTAIKNTIEELLKTIDALENAQ